MTIFAVEKRLFHFKKFLFDTVFCLFVFCHASNNTTSPNIEGRMPGASPTSNFGGPSPQSP